jgi:eukaryotic-like serine/threonine-protein kinase
VTGFVTALKFAQVHADSGCVTALTTGKRVGSRYLLRRPLGHGGICTVFEGVHLYTSRRLAVKILNEDYLHHEEARLRLLDEARALGMVRHPHIVEVYDAGTWENAPYIVMELLEGRNVEGLLTTRGKLQAPDVLQVARQVAMGLGHAHTAGIVHRDVKPGNVVIVRNPMGREQATLIDFGIARLPKGTDKTSVRFAGNDGFVGTPEYMAPEQLAGQTDVDGRADVYALGIMMWECLTEAVPITGTWQEVLAQHTSGFVASLRSVRPDLPQSVTDIVERCLSRDPRGRFPDMNTLIQTIDATGLCRSHTRLLDYGERETQDPLPSMTPQARVPEPLHIPTKDPFAEPRPVVSPARNVSPSRPREAPRAPFSAPIRVLVQGETVDLRSEDISETGLLAIGPMGFVAGESCVLRFALPTTGEIISAHVVVRWVRGRAGGSDRASCAIGFQFVDPPTQLMSSIAAYVQVMCTT